MDYDVKKYGCISVAIAFVITCCVLANCEGCGATGVSKEIQMEAVMKMYIKENMNDPRSFEYISTDYKNMGTYYIVSTKFRGKNAFGGKVVNTVTAEFDSNGNMIQILDYEYY